MIVRVKYVKNAYLRFTRIRSVCSNSTPLYQCNSKITKCFRNGDIRAALDVFDEMPNKNTVTWNCMISGYVKNGKIHDARRVFDEMSSRNVVSWTAMLNGYAKCGRLDEARRLFDAMTDKNVVCWNAMLSGYVMNRRIGDAKRLFDEMPEKNSVAWATIIDGCFCMGLVDEAEKLFNACPIEAVLVNNAMLAGCVEMENLESLWKLFTEMRELDVASWTSVIRGFMRAGNMEKARNLFDKMPTKDIIAWTVMIQGYVQNNQIEDAQKLFYEMPHRDIVAWNSMIDGYVKNGKLEQALELFKKMPKHNIVSWNTILQGYTQEDDMLKAQIFFDNIPNKDQTTWNIMICGYQSDMSFDLYTQMLQKGVKPDQVTFTGLISISGSLAVHSWGKAMHSCVIKYGYCNDSMIISSFISMYSKCGFMNDANLVFATTIRKDTVSWNAMIVAHAYHGCAVESQKLFSSMTESGFRPDHLTFLGLLTGFAHSGMVKESLECFNSMEKHWDLNPKAEHYTCMIDILGRSGMLVKAHELVKRLPVEIPVYTWITLLSCCRVHENYELGELVARKICGTRGLDAEAGVVWSSMYAARGMWDDAANVRTVLARRGVKKETGCSWIELKGRVFLFVYNDRSHTPLEELHRTVESLSTMMEEYG